MTSSTTSTPRVILDVAVRHLLHESEESFRIQTICEETGLSPSAIYGHFLSRIDLINTAYVEIYKTALTEALTLLQRAETELAPHSSVVDLMHLMQTSPVSSDAARSRRTFNVLIVALSARRPSLAKHIATIYATWRDSAEQIFQRLIARGVLSDRLTPSEWTQFLQASWLAPLYDDLTHVANGYDRWDQILVKLGVTP